MLNVDRILKEKNINRSKLSELLGRPDNRSYATNLLKSPSLDSLYKIADALEVEVSDLFETEQKKITPIYIKDRNDIERVVGYIDLDKIGFIFKG